MSTSSEVAFRAPVRGGELVGSIVGSGPPALLLHGGPGLSDYLAPLAAELRDTLTVARYQQRGLPPSVVDGERSVEGHVADAIAVLDALGWERAWMIGHSWGGHLAMHVAVAHPQRTIGLAVLDGLGAVPDGGGAALGENLLEGLTAGQRQRMAELDELAEAGEATDADRAEAFSIVWPHYFADPASAPPMPEYRFDHDSYAETMVSIDRHFAAGTLVSGLPRQPMPALILHGAASPIPALEAERTAALLGEARLEVLPGVGHWAWVERPGSVRAAMRSMLEG